MLPAPHHLGWSWGLAKAVPTTGVDEPPTSGMEILALWAALSHWTPLTQLSHLEATSKVHFQSHLRQLFRVDLGKKKEGLCWKSLEEPLPTCQGGLAAFAGWT